MMRIRLRFNAMPCDNVGMKKLIALAVIMCLFSSCATVNKRFDKIKPGMTKDDVSSLMNTPPDTEKPDTWIWERHWADLVVNFDQDGKVISRQRKTDRAARGQAMAAAFRSQAATSASQPQQSSQDVYNSVSPTRPVTTHCTSQNVGGTVYTNCQ